MTQRDYNSLDKIEKVSEEKLLSTLAELGGQRVADDDIVFEGRRMVLPETMSLRSAKKFIEKKIAQEEEVTAFNRAFRYRPWDGAHALQSALKKVFGTTGIGMATYTFFGKNPPELVTIETGPGEQTQVPWGRIEFPILEAEMNLGGVLDPEYGLLFSLVIECPRKFRAHVEGLFKAVEHELQHFSIYKGKAITGAEQPTFIDPFVVDASQVVYTDEVLAQLDANIWSMLEHTEDMEALGVPMKRSVLFGGPYGTGKSLGAMLTAQKAVENGWTFIQCRPGKDNLAQVMQTAQLYQPAVVFYEDVDTLAQAGDPEAVSKLLDMFDGIAVKGTKLLAILTTNHPDRIHKGMIRPGRLDAVVNIAALDRDSIERLIKAVVPNHLLEATIDYDEIGAAMEDFLPAFIKEAIDRAVRYAVARVGGKPDVLTTSDFVNAARGLRPQLDLMNEATEGVKTATLDRAFGQLVDKRLSTHVVTDGSFKAKIVSSDERDYTPAIKGR